MGQINSNYGLLASSVTREIATPSPQGAEDLRGLRQAVTKAVGTLNDAGFAGDGRTVTFSLDAATKRPVIKVVNVETREVVAQWPSEYALRLAEELNQLKRNSG